MAARRWNTSSKRDTYWRRLPGGLLEENIGHYDLSSSGIHHVIASKEDINVLVFDNQRLTTS